MNKCLLFRTQDPYLWDNFLEVDLLGQRISPFQISRAIDKLICLEFINLHPQRQCMRFCFDIAYTRMSINHLICVTGIYFDFIFILLLRIIFPLWVSSQTFSGLLFGLLGFSPWFMRTSRILKKGSLLPGFWVRTSSLHPPTPATSVGDHGSCL